MSAGAAARRGVRRGRASPTNTAVPSLPPLPPNVFVAVTDTEKLKNSTETETDSVAVPVTEPGGPM